MSSLGRIVPVVLALALLGGTDAEAKGNFVTRVVASVKDKLAARKAVRAAKADWKAFLAEPLNKDLATFYKGARQESGVRDFRFLRGTTLAISSAYAAVGALAGDPIALGIGLMGLPISQSSNKTIDTAEREARRRVLEQPTAKVSIIRLRKWQEAGIIN